MDRLYSPARSASSAGTGPHTGSAATANDMRPMARPPTIPICPLNLPSHQGRDNTRDKLQAELAAPIFTTAGLRLSASSRCWAALRFPRDELHFRRVECKAVAVRAALRMRHQGGFHPSRPVIVKFVHGEGLAYHVLQFLPFVG